MERHTDLWLNAPNCILNFKKNSWGNTHTPLEVLPQTLGEGTERKGMIRRGNRVREKRKRGEGRKGRTNLPP